MICSSVCDKVIIYSTDVLILILGFNVEISQYRKKTHQFNIKIHN